MAWTDTSVLTLDGQFLRLLGDSRMVSLSPHHRRPSLLGRSSVTTAPPIHPPALDPPHTYTHASPSVRIPSQGLIIDKNKGNTLKVDRHRYVKVVGEAGGGGRAQG